MQWNIGDLGPGSNWQLTITFTFGGAAGIEADAGPNMVWGTNQPGVLDGSQSTSVGTIVSYEWDLDNNGIYDISVASPTYSYAGWSEAGDYTVGFRVTDDENRNDTDTVTIHVVPNVDLTITDISFGPPEIQQGKQITFNATVENTGDDDIEDDFYVRFEIDSGLIGSKLVGGLGGGESVDISQTWTASAGDYTLRVRGDYGDEIIEVNETNNDRTLALPTIMASDLTVAEVSFSPATAISDGDMVIFDVTVENIGDGDTSHDIYVRFEVDDVYIGSQVIAGGVPAGGSTTVSQDWYASGGSHIVAVYADEYGSVDEDNTTNNQKTISLPAIDSPDLFITDIAWTPTDITAGQSVVFVATIKNGGAGSTSREFFVRLDIDGQYVGRLSITGLAAGQTKEIEQAWQATWADEIRVSVDEYDDVPESIEGNNQHSEDLPGVPYPDLTITDLQWELSGATNVGDQIAFTATVENTGGPFSSSFYVSLLINDEYAGTREIVGGLLPGQLLVTTLTWTVQPRNNPSVTIVADYTDAIPESDEENNANVEVVPITIPSPDLRITQLTFNRTGVVHDGNRERDGISINDGIAWFPGDIDDFQVREGNHHGHHRRFIVVCFI